MYVFLTGGSVASASSTGAVGSGTQVDTTALGHPADVLDMPVDPNEPTYCLCHQVSYGEMIGCDNPDVSFVIYTAMIIFFSSLLFVTEICVKLSSLLLIPKFRIDIYIRS